MRKILCFLMAIIILIGVLSGCSASKKNSDKLTVITTIFPFYDIVREVAGDKVDLSLMISPGTEPHDFEPTPKDIIKISNADLFVYNGGESDEWVEDILDSVGENVKILKMIDRAALIHEEDIYHVEGDEYDEHIWTSIDNMITLTGFVSDELSKLDKNNSAVYSENSENYAASLNELKNEFKITVDNSKKKTIVIADRFPLLYLFKEFGIDFESAFPGCTSETQPSPKTVAKLIDFVKENGIHTVFKIDNSSDSLGVTILGEGVKTLYSLHNVTKEQFDKGETYISLMELNVNALKEALG